MMKMEGNGGQHCGGRSEKHKGISGKGKEKEKDESFEDIRRH